ncbi:hypothetical protein RI054_21g94600 [Pseudoscourfieldia marina]
MLWYTALPRFESGSAGRRRLGFYSLSRSRSRFLGTAQAHDVLRRRALDRGGPGGPAEHHLAPSTRSFAPIGGFDEACAVGFVVLG